MEKQYIGETNQLTTAALKQQEKEKMNEYLNNRVLDLDQQIQAILRHLNIQLSRCGGYQAWSPSEMVLKPKKKWWEFWK